MTPGRTLAARHDLRASTVTLALYTGLSRLLQRELLFTGTALLLLALTLPLLLAQQLDTRTLAGISVWNKPLKFSAALAVYLLTLACYARCLSPAMLRTKRYRVFSAVVVFCIAAEMVWIIRAAALGVGSHFNVSTPVLELTYALMGVAAVTLTSAALVYGVALLRYRQSPLPPAARLALGQGLILTFVLTLIVAGYMSGNATHLVAGNLSDAEAVPYMGWARDGGDLRVAHFFASHALHVIPLAGYMFATLLPARMATVLVYIASVAYAALVAFVFIQALAGRPFIPL